jgi:N-acetylglutamate synthase-like GNAT family acetyltransferase
MSTPMIQSSPERAGAIRLLEASELPVSDLTDAHMADFFYAGSSGAPVGLVGLEFRGEDALLRSLAVALESRGSGLGSALVEKAESHARARGARAIFLLTTTAERFFKRRGYQPADRATAPEAIRTSREFADLCPASSAFLVKYLE